MSPMRPELRGRVRCVDSGDTPQGHDHENLSVFLLKLLFSLLCATAPGTGLGNKHQTLLSNQTTQHVNNLDRQDS